MSFTPPASEEEAVQSLCPPVIAEVKTQPVCGRILLVDGFTVTAADTPENQAGPTSGRCPPQNSAQQVGLGFRTFVKSCAGVRLVEELRWEELRWGQTWFSVFDRI